MTIKSQDYYMLTIDPLHIGSGGISLGKVDNPITIDPATHLPKPPGTGFSGGVKYFTDLALVELEKLSGISIGRHKQNGESPWCASTRGKCGNDCLVCYTFGYTTDDGKSSKGVLAFCDAHVLLFPIFSSMYGRIWVTSDRIFNEHFKPDPALSLAGFKVRTNQPSSAIQGRLEAGGILFDTEVGDSGKIPNSSTWNTFSQKPAFVEMAKKLVIVPDELFPFLVQKNLEQRTSVAIDPETGAAASGALFTFEAVPEKTLFTFQVNMNEYKNNNSPFKKSERKAMVDAIKRELRIPLGEELTPLGLIKLGFQGIKEFGMGGMNTRGFGRMEISEK